MPFWRSIFVARFILYIQTGANRTRSPNARDAHMRLSRSARREHVDSGVTDWPVYVAPSEHELAAYASNAAYD